MQGDRTTRTTIKQIIYQKIQEIKGKLKPKLRILSNQQGSASSDQEEIKGRWKHCTESLYSGN